MVGHPPLGRDKSGPYALGIASLAVSGHFVTDLLVRVMSLYL
jgi:hypothetical protein